MSLGIAGHPGAVLEAVHDAATGRVDNRARARQPWLDELRALEESKTEKLMPLFQSDASPIHPYRVAWELNEFLTEDTIYIGDGGDVVTISAQAVQPRSPRALDGPGRARLARASGPASRWRPSSPIPTRKCSATTVTAPSA